jgi:hypothetical protein
MNAAAGVPTGASGFSVRTAVTVFAAAWRCCRSFAGLRDGHRSLHGSRGISARRSTTGSHSHRATIDAMRRLEPCPVACQAATARTRVSWSTSAASSDSERYADDLPYWTRSPASRRPHLVVPYALDTNDSGSHCRRFSTAMISSITCDALTCSTEKQRASADAEHQHARDTGPAGFCVDCSVCWTPRSTGRISASTSRGTGKNASVQE